MIRRALWNFPVDSFCFFARVLYCLIEQENVFIFVVVYIKPRGLRPTAFRLLLVMISRRLVLLKHLKYLVFANTTLTSALIV